MADALLTCPSSEPAPTGFPKRTPVYSFSWAHQIVERAFKSYPRAWKIILDITALEERQLCYLLACSDPAWPALRSMVHTLDRWLTRQAAVGPAGRRALPITSQMLSTLVKFGGKNAPESLVAYLTDRISRLIIEEQVKRAEGVGSDTPDILSGPPAEITPDGVQYVFDF